VYLGFTVNDSTPKWGVSTAVLGLTISVVATVLLFAHMTDEYHSAIQDVESIALGYLGLILLGMSVSITGVALLLWASHD
jgi:hypothetical protein